MEENAMATQTQNQTVASHNPTIASNNSNNSGNMNSRPSDQKEKEKKVKDMKAQLIKMEKSLVEGTKVFIEKKKKNDIYLKDNEVLKLLIFYHFQHLSQSTKQKALIIEQVKKEIEQYRAKVEELKIDKDDAKSVISNSSNASNASKSSNNKGDKKTIMGYMKNFFKKGQMG